MRKRTHFVLKGAALQGFTVHIIFYTGRTQRKGGKVLLGFWPYSVTAINPAGSNTGPRPISEELSDQVQNSVW